MTGKTPKHADSEMDTWARLMRVSQAVLQDVQAEIKAKGFPPLSWYDALLELRRAGKPGLRPYALQREMLLTQYNLSRLADRLVEAGYADRLPCEEDGRGQVLVITRDGRDLLRRMWPIYRAAVEARFGCRIGSGEARQLYTILGRLVD